MPLQPLAPRRLYRQIADQLRALIQAGEFPVGSRLPAERDLALQLGVSRPSVREALIALEVEGLVAVRMGSGVVVLAGEPAATATPVDAPFGPFEIIRACQVVEGELAALAAQADDPAVLPGLQAAVDQMRGDIATDRTPSMSQRLQGKTAFLTAAGQGIGRAIAEAFVREGASVIATDLDPALLDSLAAATGCRTQVLDATDGNAIRRTAQAVGPVDVLVNAAGFVHAGTVLDCTEDQWDFAFNLNVRSQFRTIQAFLPGMLAPVDGRGGRGGSIINLASVAGSLKGAPNRFVYGSTKAAVIGLTKAVAADFVTRGVRCNAICPGTVESPSLRERIAAQAQASGQTLDQVEAAFIARQPMGRLGRTTEIAALAVYLASDESAFTTGTAQVIDGGWSN